ncbi:aerobic-type carbon monoxide dehydrogenase [Streptomyces sp. HCCB10043]|nr:aerobic-type carbon monoxide dehydrogenase [Streptomyces sp. HCCB10043]
MVEDGEDHRLQQHALGEGPLDPQDRGAGEVDLALRIAPDVAAEAVVRQPFEGRLVHDVLLPQEADHLVVEVEVLHRVQHPAGARDDAVPPPLGQPAGERLEDRVPVGGAGLEGRLHHGQFVLVGEERGRRNADPPTEVRCVHGWDATPYSSK